MGSFGGSPIQPQQRKQVAEQTFGSPAGAQGPNPSPPAPKRRGADPRDQLPLQKRAAQTPAPAPAPARPPRPVEPIIPTQQAPARSPARPAAKLPRKNKPEPDRHRKAQWNLRPSDKGRAGWEALADGIGYDASTCVGVAGGFIGLFMRALKSLDLMAKRMKG